MAVGLFQPAPNPAPNAAGFAQAASGIFNTMQQIVASRQAQQQKLQQQTLKDQFEQELQLRKAGYTPYLQTTGADPSGLKRREAQQVDASRVISDPYGRKWVAPTKPDATPQQSFTDTKDLLEHGGQPLDANGNVWSDTTTPRFRMDDQGQVEDTGMFGVHAPVPDPTRVVTPPGAKQGVYMPPVEQTLQEKLRIEAAAKPGHTRVDTEHFSSPLLIDEESGQVKPLNVPQGVTQNEKPDKPDKYIYNHFADDAGRVTITRIGPDDATPEMWNGKAWVGVPAGAQFGPKRKDPDGTGGPTPGQKLIEDRFKARELRSASALKGSRLEKAESDYARDLKDAGPDSTKIQAAKDRLWTAKQRAQDEYEEALKEQGLTVQHVDYSNQRSKMQTGPIAGQGGGQKAGQAPPQAGSRANPYR